ncbi:MAG: Gfo/Idh/MocA family oxidoreductase [Candidatus Hydrogenedentes bacterium]|nr:Gfo/Idh/MocA family oxidoreductase [Candidatus Hydrogenedentota bacterium]
MSSESPETNQRIKKTKTHVGIPRRRFLGHAAAATAFAIMKPRTALGAEANSRIECGVIGLGGRGRMIATMVKEHGGYQITSVADYFPDVVEHAGEAYSVAAERRFSGLLGYQKMLASGVDAVFLETPPYCFPEHTAAAAEAGCHIYIAKPLGCDVPGCLAIQEAARKTTEAKRVFLVDFQTRTDPLFIEGVRRVHVGEIGKVCLLSSVYCDESFSDPPLTGTIESRLQHLIWVNDVNLGGGSLVNAGIHSIDIALWIAQATPVSAMGCSRVARTDPHGDSGDVFSLTYEFADGLLLNHRGEHLKDKYNIIACHALGQDGNLETDYSGQVRMDGLRAQFPGGQVVDLYRQGAIRNIDTFHKSIVNGVYDNPTVEPSVNATLATVLGREAGRRNTKLTWNEIIQENTRLEVDTTGLTL